MGFNATMRTFCKTIVASVAVCSGHADIKAQAATALVAQPREAQLVRASHALTRASGVAGFHTASTGDVIVSTTQSVYVYSNTLELVAQINNLPGQPAGLALDAAGNLYIANFSSHGIPVYKNDYKTQIATLSAPNGSEGIAVANNGIVGTVAGSQVNFYASGSTSACSSLSLPGVHTLYQGAFDAAGNFYVTGQGPNGNGIVGVLHGGCPASGFKVLSTANSLGQYVFGIQVTRFGKIAVGDQTNNTIYTYNPPINGALGEPIAAAALIGANGSSIYQFAFTAKGAFAFVAEESGIVAKYAYPAGGNPLQSIGQRQRLYHPFGLVVAPPAQT